MCAFFITSPKLSHFASNFFCKFFTFTSAELTRKPAVLRRPGRLGGGRLDKRLHFDHDTGPFRKDSIIICHLLTH